MSMGNQSDINQSILRRLEILEDKIEKSEKIADKLVKIFNPPESSPIDLTSIYNKPKVIGQYTCPRCGQQLSTTIDEIRDHEEFCKTVYGDK
jgi:hypothetical protein